MEDSQTVNDTKPTKYLNNYALSVGSYHSYKSVALEDIELKGNDVNQRWDRAYTRNKTLDASSRDPNTAHVWETDLKPPNDITKDSLSDSKHGKRHEPGVGWKAIRTTIVEDVRNAPWKWFLRRFCSHLLPLAMISGLVGLVVRLSISNVVNSMDGDVCQPDGTFKLSRSSYSPWSRDAIFEINISFGSFSFGVAKFIDVSWDVVVGRGGQALFAAISYQIFTRALTRTLENSTVSCETFEALTLQHDTFFGVLKLTRHYLRTGGRRAKFAMFWMILCALFVLAVPTWLSAMTGYAADISAFIADNGGTLVPVSKFVPVIYTIHDGQRLGEPYTNDFRVTVPWDKNIQLDIYNRYSCDEPPATVVQNDSTGVYEAFWKSSTQQGNCTMLWRVSSYVATYGLLGLNATQSDFFLPNGTNMTLPGPSLNITMSLAAGYDAFSQYLPDDGWWDVPAGGAWRPRNTTEYPFATSGPLFYNWNSGTLYNLNQLNDAGSCQQPTSNVRYKWGFSYAWLYLFVLTWLLWTICMTALYFDSHLNSRLGIVKRHMGLQRAVADLSLAMQKRLDMDQTVLMGNSELQPSTQRGHVTYADLPLNSLPHTRLMQLRIWWREFKVWPWARQEKWWLAAMLLFVVLFILSLAGPLSFRIGWSSFFSFLPVLGILLVLVVGRDVRGRWLLFVLCFLAFWVGNIWWILAWEIPVDWETYIIQGS